MDYYLLHRKILWRYCSQYGGDTRDYNLSEHAELDYIYRRLEYEGLEVRVTNTQKKLTVTVTIIHKQFRFNPYAT